MLYKDLSFAERWFLVRCMLDSYAESEADRLKGVMRGMHEEQKEALWDSVQLAIMEDRVDCYDCRNPGMVH